MKENKGIRSMAEFRKKYFPKTGGKTEQWIWRWKDEVEVRDMR